MPFYIRKGINFGPIRLNLSKSGLGVSLGTTGLRIGSGPKGNYIHAGRGGLYFRKSLPSLADVARKKPEATTDAHDPETGEVLTDKTLRTEASPREATLPWHWLAPLLLLGYLAYHYWPASAPEKPARIAAEERHVAGDALSDAVQQQADAFLDAALAGEAKQASAYVALPFTYMRDGKPRSIRTRVGFERNMALIFTPEFSEAVQRARSDAWQLNGTSPALSGGLIHFTTAGKPKHFNNF